jgi:hypothetical protein
MSNRKTPKPDPIGRFHLVYVGDGEHYVIGYPTSDVEVEDLDEALRLAESGLYEIVEGEPLATTPAAKGAEGQE